MGESKNRQDQLQSLERLEMLFFARARTRRNELADSNGLLAHYTTAENAMRIIKSQSIWMRETRCMSDFSEVQHGHGLLVRYFHQDGKRDKFCAALDNCFTGCGRDALARFDAWWAHIQSSTYISCFSQHTGESQDRYGRLSMWQMFGNRAGVAIIMKPPNPYAALPLNVYLSPVEYFSEEVFWQEIDAAVARIEQNHSSVSDFTRDAIVFAAYRMLVMATVSLKHPVFEEEREWRLIHLPFEHASQYVKRETETISGVPQIIYKIALEDHPEDNIVGISIPQLLDKVLIGPSQYPGPIHAALTEELTKAGVEDAAKKVVFSYIPLRT